MDSRPNSPNHEKRPEPLKVHTRREVAAVFGVALRTVSTWAGEGMPRLKLSNLRYEYDVPGIHWWLAQRYARDRAKVAARQARREVIKNYRRNLYWKKRAEEAAIQVQQARERLAQQRNNSPTAST